MILPSPKIRAIVGMLLFTTFGVIGVLISLNNLYSTWPLIVFYALLVWNDYFSIKHFSKIIPLDRISQMVIDVSLAVIHFISILFFADPIRFAMAMTILFVVAVIKYAYDLPAVENSRALHRKIKIDSLGAFITSLALAGMMSGYVWPAMILWTGIFACASIYVIYINPLYKDTLGAA